MWVIIYKNAKYTENCELTVKMTSFSKSQPVNIFYIQYPIFTKNSQYKILTWKTFGAEIRLASAEDKVAETIPAITIGPKADANCITCENIVSSQTVHKLAASHYEITIMQYTVKFQLLLFFVLSEQWCHHYHSQSYPVSQSIMHVAEFNHPGTSDY